MELISDQGLRIDGRRAGELRKIYCKLGVYEHVDGSAYLEQGNTKVLATVMGPHEMHKSLRSKMSQDTGFLNCKFKQAAFASSERKRSLRLDRKGTEMKLNLTEALSAGIRLELYRRSQIDLCVEVFQADGSTLAACVNAATLALLEAGVSMREYVVACTASLGKDLPMVDISHLEESLGAPTLTLAALPLSGKIALSEMSQRLHSNHFQPVVELALKGCQDVYTILDNAVRAHINTFGAR